MSDPVTVRRALLSVSDKTDLVPFARGLVELGIELVSTGGTAEALRTAGLAVIPVETITGSPEMMDGRVKTLHPAVHGGVLARRDRPTHVEAMMAHGITAIDLVCINLYPFEQTILVDGVTHAAAIEQIDIGGPALLRSASKNHEFVVVITSPTQYDRVITELRRRDGGTSIELRRSLAAAAFARTASYDAAIASWMGEHLIASPSGFPEMLDVRFARLSDLRYGENPHQKAAVYADPAAREGNAVTARVLHGKPLSFNNLLDAAAALELVRDLHEGRPGTAAAAVIKHTNACGAAVAPTPAEAFARAYAGDPLAAYGGILAMSRPLDAGAAAVIVEGQRFLEVILAPAFDADAVATLGARWANVRLLATGELRSGPEPRAALRSVPGGVLVQEWDRKPAAPSSWTHAAGPEPSPATIDEAVLAWTIVKHLKSNAIAITAGSRLLGGGPGQVDRVGAARLAIEKAGDALAEARGRDATIVAASDAFFPFADGPRLLIDAGVTCIIQPGGSKRDSETIELCEANGVTCLFTGVRHFRH